MVNIAAEVWAQAESDPARVAVRSPVTITYGGLRQAGRRVAGAVRSAGYAPLDRVLFIAPTIPEFPEIYYGLHAAGVTVVTMNTMSTHPEIGYVLADSGTSLVVAWHECADAARTAAAERGIEFWEIEPGHSFEAPPLTDVHEHAHDDTAVIMYTSGTTGKPKGAELTAANLIRAVQSFTPVFNLTGEDRVGTALPLFHSYGQSICMNTALAAGASISLLTRFEPGDVLRMMKRDRLTILLGVPTMWNAMLHVEGDFRAEDFTELRLAGSGGASLPVEVILAFEDRFGCRILEGYGLTESTGGATFNDLNREQKTGTVGRALPGMTVEVRDSDGHALPPGEPGEVYLKGPMIMKGYWNRPEATAQDLRDGWLKTGDIGALDHEGYLSILDRVKDLIIRGGYNVYPREVEEVLYEHADIVEVAVIGAPDEHYGEEIAAVIALAPGSTVTGEEIRSWAKQRLSAYKVPRLFSFVEQLPRGATGKILKRAIDRDELRSSAHREVSP
ncbi:long-chain acyl-CoA synthetase [Amycolatopsis sulphurea]|uniref:Long-chain acyl-CoA synthetase n=1 Tax=Amycolatopsis sulphurea TaxID=76022 RepID=A0A2A9FJX1_9PSEU|nr:long-chain fatty acid--CoA ligase [Amycolatopsis sulphurea]PFG51041.1 long-chain acyl-CoA synthetase [Amycolatopsis sulphurea]